MALGAGSATPWQMVTAYSVFANGGYKIEPFIVRDIVDEQKNVLGAGTTGQRRRSPPCR